MALVLVLFLSPAISWAAEKPASVTKTTWNDIFSDIIGHYPLPKLESDDSDFEKIIKLDIPKNWEFNVEAKRYIESHTTYEFGNPSAPYTKPLSRLKFPMNTWWMNFDLRRTLPRWSVGGHGGLCLSTRSDGWMQDWDWTSVGSANIMSNYGKGYCHILDSFQFGGDVDVNISDWLRLPPGLEMRPLFAFRFQRLAFLDHDGEQYDYLPAYDNYGFVGDSIRFRQDWYTYMIGMRGSYSVKLSKHATVKIKGEADWGPALGYNLDEHLRRNGRLTTENSVGNALYFLAGVDMVIAKTVTIGVGVDYMFIRTSGSHRWFDPAPPAPDAPIDASTRDGVNVWSDQLGLTMHASYAF